MARHARRRRAFRPDVLPDLAVRSRGHGPATSPVHAGKLSRFPGRRLFQRRAERAQVRRLHGHHEQRVFVPADEGQSAKYRNDQQQFRHRRGAHRLSPESEGAGDPHRHRVLVLAGRDPSRLPGAAEPRNRHGPRRRREPVPDSRVLSGHVPRRHAGARRPVQDVRQQRGRLRAGRRRGHGRAQAPQRRRARWRQHPRRDHRLGHQPGRQDQRHHRAQRQQPDRPAARHLPPLRDRRVVDRLRGNPRHRHQARRPDRAGSAVDRVQGARWQEERLRAGRDQDQSRPHLRRGRRCGRAQGAAEPAEQGLGAEREFQAGERAVRFRRLAVLPQPDASRLAFGGGPQAARGGQRIRLQRHQRPCGHRRVRTRAASRADGCIAVLHRSAVRAQRGAAHGHGPGSARMSGQECAGQARSQRSGHCAARSGVHVADRARPDARALRLGC